MMDARYPEWNNLDKKIKAWNSNSAFRNSSEKEKDFNHFRNEVINIQKNLQQKLTDTHTHHELLFNHEPTQKPQLKQTPAPVARQKKSGLLTS